MLSGAAAPEIVLKIFISFAFRLFLS